MAERAAKAEGLTDVDLNYPDHVDDNPAEFARRLGDLGLGVNGLAMRYYTNPAFKLGAFTNPDPPVRREAIDLTARCEGLLLDPVYSAKAMAALIAYARGGRLPRTKSDAATGRAVRRADRAARPPARARSPAQSARCRVPSQPHPTATAAK